MVVGRLGLLCAALAPGLRADKVLGLLAVAHLHSLGLEPKAKTGREDPRAASTAADRVTSKSRRQAPGSHRVKCSLIGEPLPQQPYAG